LLFLFVNRGDVINKIAQYVGFQKKSEEENTLILPTRPNSSSIGAIAFGNK
jgi:hypothetical protein